MEILLGCLIVAGFVMVAPQVVADAIATWRASKAGEWDFLDRERDRRSARRERWANAWAALRRRRHVNNGGDGNYRPGARAYWDDLYHGFWERRLEKARAKAAAREPYVYDPDRPSFSERWVDLVDGHVAKLRDAWKSRQTTSESAPEQPPAHTPTEATGDGGAGASRRTEQPGPGVVHDEPRTHTRRQPPDPPLHGPYECPDCGDPIRNVPPREWDFANWGPAPNASHPNGNPTCSATGQPYRPPADTTTKPTDAPISGCTRCGRDEPVLYSTDDGGWECHSCVVGPAAIDATPSNSNEGDTTMTALATTTAVTEVQVNEHARTAFKGMGDAAVKAAEHLAALERARNEMAAHAKALSDGTQAKKFDAGATVAAAAAVDAISAGTLAHWTGLCDEVVGQATSGLASLEKYRDSEALVANEGIDATTLEATAA